MWHRGTSENKEEGAESGRSDWISFRRVSCIRTPDRKCTMIDGLLLAAATTVILVLYHKVKAWDERQGAAPARSTFIR